MYRDSGLGYPIKAGVRCGPVKLFVAVINSLYIDIPGPKYLNQSATRILCNA